MDSKKLNASIVTYHSPLNELNGCLDSLLACELIDRIDVIDNSSQPSIEQLCDSKGERVEYRPNPNIGFGRAHNIALRRSLDENADYHLIINADTYFDPGTIESCLRYMEEHPECGQLIPRAQFPGGEYQPVCHPLPSPLELIIHRFTPFTWCRKRRNHYEMRDRDMDNIHNVPAHHGCFMLLRCKALREVGLFDERFFMYGEDFDLTRRIHARYTTISFPGARFTHMFRGESRIKPRLFWIHCVSMLKYFAKWGFLIDRERMRFNRELDNDGL